jgi:hypothetical protein
MSQVYLLIFDGGDGTAPEDWNLNYIGNQIEVFTSDEDRQKRIDFLKTFAHKDEDDDDYAVYSFFKKDLDFMTPAQIQTPYVWDSDEDWAWEWS